MDVPDFFLENAEIYNKSMRVTSHDVDVKNFTCFNCPGG